MKHQQKFKEVDKTVLVERLKLIEKYLARLKRLKGLSKGRFALPDNFDIAAYNLRSALQAIFDICGHILARMPEANKNEEYKAMALEMGRQGIVSQSFAKNQLHEMAGYRNRLTHFYFEVKPEEMYNIIQNDLGDFEIFMKAIKKILVKHY